MKTYRIVAYTAFGLAALTPLSAHAQVSASATGATKTVLEMRAGVEKRLIPSSDQVSVARSQDAGEPGVNVTIQPGKDDYPGVRVTPEGAPWDFSKFGHVEARIVNTGTRPLSLSLRADNAGDWKDNPWNTETLTLEPGASGKLSTIFGYAYGYKPGYALKPGAVTNLLLFAAKSDAAQSFRIESIVAAGPAGEKPSVAPDDVRTKPEKGILLGNGVALEPSRQVAAQGVKTVLTRQSALYITFPANASGSVSLKPAMGRWDLRDSLQVRVKLHNGGKTPVTPRVRVETNGGISDWVSAATPMAPGASGEIVVPFLRTAPIDLGKPETATRFTSDAVSAVTISAKEADTERTLVVDSIRAAIPPAPKLPAWLGKRPPVPGDWVQTLNDDFDGTTINGKVWDTEGENYYDKATHWSKKNVLVGGGFARLRYEKKTGFQNDDPKRNRTDYAAGYLNTYGKWTQRYGYFEARMKLPTAPGLWPAFWMMPERGLAAGPEQWKRQDTANGGMEFDIMEHLTRWGPNRYNIAMHYDGYDKDHKSIGSDSVYVQPDKDGFVTCGLLWTPGSAIYYCNGIEVLRWENPRIADVPSSLMFTLPSGGWDNDSVDNTRLPADFVIDYVRVWQRKDLAGGATKPGTAKK